VSRYFTSGIQVPIVIFADPTGREIAGTRLGPEQAPVKSTYLENARRALESFRGGLTKEKAREQWAEFGRALRVRTEGKDSGAGVELLQRIRDGAAEKSALRVSVQEYLDRIDREEADGLLQSAVADLSSEDPKMGIDTLFWVLRDFPGLPTAAKAKELLDKAKGDPKRAADHAAAEKEHRAWLSLREGDRLARDGKKKEAAEAFARTVKEFPDTPAANEAATRKP
jgi:ketosteroid isomerase-like protein